MNTKAQQIDGQLALDLTELYQAEAREARAADAVANATKARDWSRAAKAAGTAAEAQAAQRAPRAAVEAGCAEYTKAGGWTRYYLVANAGGHVHTSRACSTCRPTTEFAWLTEYSGHTAEELVELAGERACTVCFPDAPVDVTRRESRLRYDVEARAAKAAERTAKEDAKAAKLAAAGGALAEPLELDRFTTVKTVRAAKVEAVNALVEYAHRHNVPNRRVRREGPAKLATLKAALIEAGVDWTEYTAELEKKAAAKVRKEAREAAKLRVTMPWLFEAAGE